MTRSAADWNAFWDGLDAELASTPLDLSLERDEFYSPPEWTVYRLRYSGAGGYRLFAWLSAPRDAGESPMPAVVRMPDYGSVHDIIYTPLRHRAVVLNATHRGQRHSDGSLQARYPGLLTEGIAGGIGGPDGYLMRLVFADALRAVDAVLGLDELGLPGATPLAVMGSGLGGSLALAAAARRPAVGAVAADTPLALGNPRALEATPAYPLAELADYLRLHPGDRDAVLESTAPLDPVKLAPRVSVPVLLGLGRRDWGQCPPAVAEELARSLPQGDARTYDGGAEGGGHEHGVVRLAWLEQRLGLA